MKARSKTHDPEFKARVALEANKGMKTVRLIAADFDGHPVQVSEWKKKLSTQVGSVFESGNVCKLRLNLLRWIDVFVT